jgi:hypothetical protein
LKDFLAAANAQGIDVGELGVAGLTNETNIDAITDKAIIEGFMEGLTEVSNAEMYNREMSDKIVD